MFEIAWSEIFIIAVVAIVVVGPKELPAMLRTFGRALGQLRRMAREFQSTFNEALREAEKQAGTEGLKKDFDSIRSMDPTKDLRKNLDDVKRQMSARVTDTPAASATTPADAKADVAVAPRVQTEAAPGAVGADAASAERAALTVSGMSDAAPVPASTAAIPENVGRLPAEQPVASSVPASFLGIGAAAPASAPVVGPAMARISPLAAVPPSTPIGPAVPVASVGLTAEPRDPSPPAGLPLGSSAVGSLQPPAPTLTSVEPPSGPHELPRAAGERR